MRAPGLSGWGFLDKIITMIIFPAVDIRGGKCVRLFQGRADQETVYGDDPAAMGRRWQDEGASWLHVVDLDGAFGARPQNLEVIRRLRQRVNIPVQLGAASGASTPSPLTSIWASTASSWAPPS